MIKIHFTQQDLSEIRFAFSPLSELVASYFMLLNPARHAIYLSWIKAATLVLKEIRLPYFTALLKPGTLTSGAYIPDFLIPMPTTPHPDFEDEFQQLLTASDDLVRQNIRRMFDHYRTNLNTEILNHFIENPLEALQHLADEIRAYWDVVFSPHWPRINALLEGDVLYRARQLALHGPDTLFGDMNVMATYENNCLTLIMNHEEEIFLNGSGILLVPLVMAGPSDLLFQSGRQRLMLSYGARGAGLWDMQIPDLNESLCLMMGESKAKLLQYLRTPCNNGELAERLNLTPSAISQHLNHMRRAGLVEFHHNRRWVFYHLTLRGEKLLAVFES